MRSQTARLADVYRYAVCVFGNEFVKVIRVALALHIQINGRAVRRIEAENIERLRIIREDIADKRKTTVRLYDVFGFHHLALSLRTCGAQVLRRIVRHVYRSVNYFQGNISGMADGVNSAQSVDSPTVRKSRGNQYTVRREQKDAKDNAQRWQDNPRFNAGVLLTRLENHANGVVELKPTQVKAIELMLDRVAPRLSAVEQTVIEPAARLTEQEIRAQLRELVANHGGLLQELIAEHARSALATVTDARAVDPQAVATQSDSTDSTQVPESNQQATG